MAKYLPCYHNLTTFRVRPTPSAPRAIRPQQPDYSVPQCPLHIQEISLDGTGRPGQTACVNQCPQILQQRTVDVVDELPTIRYDVCTSEDRRFSTEASSSAARTRASSESGSNASRINRTRVVLSVNAVRGPCRQFQRRQVMPVSSHHIGSPGAANSVWDTPLENVWNCSWPVARIRNGDPLYLSRSSPPGGI
jgi:hypothetical protein